MKIICYIVLIAGACCAACNKTGLAEAGHDRNAGLPMSEPNEVVKAVQGSLLPGELVGFVQDPANGYCREKKIEDMTFSLQYKPLDYIVALEQRSDSIKENLRAERVKEIEGLDYFTLKIKVDKFNQELMRYKLGNQDEYYMRLQYFMSDMQKDIYLEDRSDSIPCAMFHFERTFGIAPYATFSLAFEKREPAGERTFVFNDRLFHNGIIRIHLPKEVFTENPKLKTY